MNKLLQDLYSVWWKSLLQMYSKPGNKMFKKQFWLNFEFAGEDRHKREKDNKQP